MEESKVALMSIIAHEKDNIDDLNHILSEYGEYIIGRMGIPYRKKNINIISIALDAPQNIISALSGKIGTISGITVKTIYSKINANDKT